MMSRGAPAEIGLEHFLEQKNLVLELVTAKKAYIWNKRQDLNFYSSNVTELQNMKLTTSVH